MRTNTQFILLSILAVSYCVLGTTTIPVKSEVNEKSVILDRIKRHDKYLRKGCAANVVAGSVGIGAVAGGATGAAAGAVAGSVVPLLGTAVGALVGGAVGAFTGAAAGGAATIPTEPAMCALEIKEFILNQDLGIIDDDDNETLIKEIKKLNSNLQHTEGLVIHDKSGISAKIKASGSSRYLTDSSVDVKYLVKRNLYDTKLLLKDWFAHYEKFLSELSRQISNDVGSYTLAQQRTWQDDKNYQIRSLCIDLQQNMAIITLDSYIRKLYKRVLNLENDLTKLKEMIDKMQDEAQCRALTTKLNYVPSAASGFNNLSKSVPMIINSIPASAALVPVVGQIFTGISTLNSVYCFLQKQHVME